MSNPTTPNQTSSRKLRDFRRNVTTNALSSSASANPFGNSAEFLEVGYLDQINQLAPPTVNVANFLPATTEVATNGLTIELWFKAESSGILVGQQMGTTSGAVGLAPLFYIDSSGLLRGGLFDSTQITLLSPPQNLIASQASNGLVIVGPSNALASPLSVVDGQWHHAALVVQPGNNASQSLFLDGRLAATGNANGSFGMSFVDNTGATWTAEASAAAAQLGGSITPRPQSLPSPNFLPYAQGFIGCLNELRTWNASRTITEIQQLIGQPLGSDLSIYQQQGLYGYAGSSQLQTAVQPGTYLS
ncbi:MAG TPA: LamG-like jellyroll fold domain-containing protein, partial [Pyrinomonadaceae bacterium]